MKIKLTRLLALVLVGSWAIARGEASSPSNQPADFSDLQISEQLGWLIGAQAGLTETGLSEEEIDAVLNGLRAACEGRDAPHDLQQLQGSVIEKFIERHQQAIITQRKQRNAEYFKKLKTDDSVISLPSGLCYQILRLGTENRPAPADTVRIRFTGRYIDGTVFDQSSTGSDRPVEFVVQQLTPGLTEGLQKIEVGGKAILHIPPELAYGDERISGIPPASVLVFEVELVEIVRK